MISCSGTRSTGRQAQVWNPILGSYLSGSNDSCFMLVNNTRLARPGGLLSILLLWTLIEASAERSFKGTTGYTGPPFRSIISGVSVDAENICPSIYHLFEFHREVLFVPPSWSMSMTFHDLNEITLHLSMGINQWMEVSDYDKEDQIILSSHSWIIAVGAELPPQGGCYPPSYWNICQLR